MPVYNPGFNVADPAKWGIVKDYSVMRHYLRYTTNTYGSIRSDFDWKLNSSNSLKFGFNVRQYGFNTDQFQRTSTQETQNPTEKEAGVSVASLGQVIQFGQGLNLSAGTPTSFFAPNLKAFEDTFGFNCNCINKYGDFRLTDKVFSSGTAGGTKFAVTENDAGIYGQWDYDYDTKLGEISGNVGVRNASTDVVAKGRDTKNNPVSDSNKYNDTLPSMNLIYRPIDDLYIRFAAAKTMARPPLTNLSPSLSGLSVPTDGSTSGATVSVGNTRVKPYRSTNYDLAAEWYFNKNSLLSLAGFYKKIASFPQIVSYTTNFTSIFTPDEINTLLSESTNANYIAYVNANNPITARQYRDAPGGFLQGFELNYQQGFTFLPWEFKNTGVLLNLTHVTSKLTYILDPGTPATTTAAAIAATYANGPWLGSSPNAINMTLYYSTDLIDARISVASRDTYYKTFPIASGSCSPGLTFTSTTLAGVACNSPLINDFVSSKGTTNVDAKITYNYTKSLAFTLEGLNLTNQTTNEFSYSADPQVTNYASTGRQITVGLRYRY